MAVESAAAAALIDERIASLGDWRGELLARVRAIIRAAAPWRPRRVSRSRRRR